MKNKKFIFTTRLIGELIALGCGVLLLIISRLLFASRFYEDESTDICVAHDNFMLFYKLSLALCALFLVLTLLSVICSQLYRKTLHVFHITARLSPLVCSLVIIAITLFYAYLASGGVHNITPYLLTLGFGEALTLRLPSALYNVFEQLSSSKNEKKGNKRYQ